MQAQQAQPLAELWNRFFAFLPTLAAGLLVVIAGVVGGWLAKRAIVRTLVWLRLDRLAGRVGWRAGLGKGDVRAALYNAIGNVAMLVVVLVFLDDALNRWGLAALSRVIDALVFYLPNLALVALVLGVGIALSNGLSGRVANMLREENVARASLIGKLLKGALLSVVVALALWQLQFAREIVLSAFLICFGSIGIAFAIGAGLGTARAIERGLSRMAEKKSDET
jgi:hypothetical protein